MVAGESSSVRRRVIVTRSAERSAGLSDLLLAAGFEVVEIPVTTTIDASDGGEAFVAAVRRLPAYDWVIATSPEGARRIMRCAAENGVDVSSVKRAAVGTSTAAALGGADLVPDTQTGASLGAVFPVGVGRVLLAVAESASRDVENAVRSKGWTVDRVHSYRTASTSPHDIDPTVIDSCDAITFTAASSVEAWAATFGTRVPPMVVAMGPQTADALRRAGIESFVVASEQSLPGIVRALG
jgi:uroporphyrinogen-III synthase